MLLFSWWELAYHISFACEIVKVTKWWQADLLYLLTAQPLCKSAISRTFFWGAVRSFSGICDVWYTMLTDLYLKESLWCHPTDQSSDATSGEGLEIWGLQFGEKSFADWHRCPGLLEDVCMHATIYAKVRVWYCCARLFTALVYSLFELVWVPVCLLSFFLCFSSLNFNLLLFHRFQPWLILPCSLSTPRKTIPVWGLW